MSFQLVEPLFSASVEEQMTYSDTELISSRPGAVEEISLPGLYLVFRAWLLLCPNSLLHTIPSRISLLLACIQRSFSWQVI